MTLITENWAHAAYDVGMRTALWLAAFGVLFVLASACGGATVGPGAPATTSSETPAASQSPSEAVSSRFLDDWPKTDFSKHTVPFNEISSGCPVRDCIPPLDASGATSIPGAKGGRAVFAPASGVNYGMRLPVATVRVGDTVRGYPLHILTWHEVVNDRFADVPVVVTFCPLCNTALAFDRRLGDATLDFGVSGNLRNSDLIMWDRQTESWWQQATGEGIVGTYAGAVLKPVPASVISFGDFRKAYPDAEILTENTGTVREYGINPYNDYDAAGSRPFLFNGTIDKRLDGLERVVALGRGSDSLAVPFSSLSQAGVANVKVDGARVAVLWSAGTVSALDQSDIATSRDVGAAVAYIAEAGGRSLTFASMGPGAFGDAETGSTWDVTGRASAGPLAGQQLAVAVHTVEFWFAFAAFHPAAPIWQR